MPRRAGHHERSTCSHIAHADVQSVTGINGARRQQQEAQKQGALVSPAAAAGTQDQAAAVAAAAAAKAASAAPYFAPLKRAPGVPPVRVVVCLSSFEGRVHGAEATLTSIMEQNFGLPDKIYLSVPK